MSKRLSRRGFALAGAALALAGCVTTRPRLLPATPADVLAELEPVTIIEAAEDALTIRVKSRGCTAKGDFVFRADRKDGRVLLAFARRRLETCKGSVGWADLRFSYGELGVARSDRIVIANPPLSPSA